MKREIKHLWVIEKYSNKTRCGCEERLLRGDTYFSGKGMSVFLINKKTGEKQFTKVPNIFTNRQEARDIKKLLDLGKLDGQIDKYYNFKIKKFKLKK